MNAIIHTVSGRRINLLNFRDEDICLEDIAHGLACVNRFAGQAQVPVSVAQHSIYVARLCPKMHQLQALLHDASEAYLGDVTKWLKATPQMDAYRELEEAIQRRIFRAFGCEEELALDVQFADRVMAQFEGLHSFSDFRINHLDYPPLTEKQIREIGCWQPWSWRAAKSIFMSLVRGLEANTPRERET